MSAINHPKHYNSGQFEVIDAIDDWGLGFNLGNVVKYIARAGKKNKDAYREDLEKALWYLSREIETARSVERGLEQAKNGELIKYE